MANIDTNWEYNAPTVFMDFTKEIEEPDDTFFDDKNYDQDDVFAPLVTNATSPAKTLDVTDKECQDNVLLTQADKDRLESPPISKPINVQKLLSSTDMYPTLRQSSRLVKTSKAARRSSGRSSFGLNESNGRIKKRTLKGQVMPNQKYLRETVVSSLKMAAARRKEEHIVGPTKPLRVQPTIPVGFNFESDKRMHTDLEKREAEREYDSPIDFVKTLRSGSPLPEHAGKHITRVEPFNLTENRRSLRIANEFVSMAQLNVEFQSKTPDRFRTTKRMRCNSDPLSKEITKSHHATIPNTPNLATRSRARKGSSNFMTREEQERMELEEAQKHMFKAQPLNKKIFDPPINGYKVELHHVTVPEPFNITKSKKLITQLPNTLREMQSRFGASASSLASYASVPHGGVPLIWNKLPTKPQPFTFDASDRIRQQKKQERIQKILEDEKKMSEFHANPMYVGGSNLPEKQVTAPIKVCPYNLRTDVRGALRLEQWEKEMKLKADEEEEARKFHAKTDRISTRIEPFVPIKSERALTDISTFTLNTERRAEERYDFDLQQKMKEDELAANKRKLEERKRQEDEEEVARLRREVVHKAQPMPIFPKPQVKPKSHAPTVPMSPTFETDRRLRARAVHNPQADV